MELWKELLVGGIYNMDSGIDFNGDTTMKEIIESSCYKVLKEIKEIIDDLSLSDEDCFYKIENIILVLEKNKIFCDRHDFG